MRTPDLRNINADEQQDDEQEMRIDHTAIIDCVTKCTFVLGLVITVGGAIALWADPDAAKDKYTGFNLAETVMIMGGCMSLTSVPWGAYRLGPRCIRGCFSTLSNLCNNLFQSPQPTERSPLIVPQQEETTRVISLNIDSSSLLKL